MSRTPRLRETEGLEATASVTLALGVVLRVVLPLGVLASGALLVAIAAERGEVPEHLGRAESRVGLAPDESLGPGLHLAGSGSNLVVTRALAAAYRRARPDERLVVHDSIGSTGGVRAVADGAIDIGLVARPLSASEAELGLRVVPYARVPIAILAHPDVRDADISSGELVASLRRRSPRWADGTPRVWLLRERGDAGTRVVADHVPGFGAASDEAIAARRFRVVYHDDELIRALLGTPGAIGIADLPQARVSAPTARVLALDGRVPSVDAVRDGTYPLHKDLAFVVREPHSPSVDAFLAFVATEPARAVIEATGALALSVGGAPHGEPP